jgi:predicted neuraminidase
MFIYEKAPYPSCHASTLVEVASGEYLAAWFGGKAEKAKDVQIWGSRYRDGSWSEPTVWGTEPGFPTWNPVLFQLKSGAVRLWYKAGPDPQNWTGYVRTSTDNGMTWTKPEIMPAGQFGPVRAKPIQLRDGTILAGTSLEAHRVWTPYVDRSTDDGVTWLRSNEFSEKTGHHQIQPTLIETKSSEIIALMRSRKLLKICRAVSKDGGKTFSPAEPIDVPNPSAGIDAVITKTGTICLIYNPSPILRTPISLGRSEDDGRTFKLVKNLETEPGEYSYPAMILTQSGDLAYTYTWRRTHIKFGIEKLGA